MIYLILTQGAEHSYLGRIGDEKKFNTYLDSLNSSPHGVSLSAFLANIGYLTGQSERLLADLEAELTKPEFKWEPADWMKKGIYWYEIHIDRTGKIISQDANF